MRLHSRKVVIPAAGLGTRFLPATKAQPKEMLPIFDRPAIQIVVEEAVKSGFGSVILVTGRNKQAIENHFDRSLELEHHLARTGQHHLLRQVREVSALADLVYTRQKEPLGLGHAILCTRSIVGNDVFAVILADDIIDSTEPAIHQLWEVHKKYGGSVVAVMEVPRSQVSSYGIISGERIAPRVLRVRDMVEKPPVSRAPSRLAIIGRYILTPAIFDCLERTKKGAKGEIQLTDAIRDLAKREPVHACLFTGTRYDAGDKAGYVDATIAWALKDPQVGPKVQAIIKRRSGR